MTPEEINVYRSAVNFAILSVRPEQHYKNIKDFGRDIIRQLEEHTDFRWPSFHNVGASKIKHKIGFSVALSLYNARGLNDSQGVHLVRPPRSPGSPTRGHDYDTPSRRNERESSIPTTAIVTPAGRTSTDHKADGLLQTKAATTAPADTLLATTNTLAPLRDPTNLTHVKPSRVSTTTPASPKEQTHSIRQRSVLPHAASTITTAPLEEPVNLTRTKPSIAAATTPMPPKEPTKSTQQRSMLSPAATTPTYTCTVEGSCQSRTEDVPPACSGRRCTCTAKGTHQHYAQRVPVSTRISCQYNYTDKGSRQPCKEDIHISAGVDALLLTQEPANPPPKHTLATAVTTSKSKEKPIDHVEEELLLTHAATVAVFTPKEKPTNIIPKPLPLLRPEATTTKRVSKQTKLVVLKVKVDTILFTGPSTSVMTSTKDTVATTTQPPLRQEIVSLAAHSQPAAHRFLPALSTKAVRNIEGPLDMAVSTGPRRPVRSTRNSNPRCYIPLKLNSDLDPIILDSEDDVIDHVDKSIDTDESEFASSRDESVHSCCDNAPSEQGNDEDGELELLAMKSKKRKGARQELEPTEKPKRVTKDTTRSNQVFSGSSLRATTAADILAEVPTRLLRVKDDSFMRRLT